MAVAHTHKKNPLLAALPQADFERLLPALELQRRIPEFYAFSRTLEAYKEGQNKNSVVILTTDSDYYRYLKQAGARTQALEP